MVLMLDKNLLVSVVIPTYKRSINLKRAIDSVLFQDYQNIEILIIDDNEPDSNHRKETELFMEQYAENGNVLYIKHPRNLNGAAARNTGIKHSKGGIIAFLDDDDEWEDNKISKQVGFLLNQANYSACYCLSKKYKNGVPYFLSQYQRNGKLSADLLSLKSEIYTPTLIFYKKALETIGGFDESFSRHQDFELLIKFFRQFEIICFAEHLVKVHVDDVTNHLSFDKFEEMKLRFLETFKEDIQRLDHTEQQTVYKEHYFELSYYAFKSKKMIKFLSYLAKSKPTPLFLWHKKHKFFSLIKKVS